MSIKYLRISFVICLMCFNCARAQYLVGGVNYEYEQFMESPKMERLGFHLDYSWEHLVIGAKYRNAFFDEKVQRIQEMGIEGRWQFWKNTNQFNCFVDVCAMTQIQANRKGTIVDYYNGEPYLFFYKSKFSSTYQFGVNVTISNVIIFGSGGIANRYWQYSSIYDPNKLYGEPVWGPIGTVGINYQFPLKNKGNP